MMINNNLYAGALVLMLAVPGMAVAAGDPYGDVYGEEDSRDFIEGEAWKEQGIVLPAYPDTDSRDLIEVDLLLRSFPFQLFIDPDSVSVGEDKVVRYTAILKSGPGSTNVLYEGMRCTTGQYRRYAYGSQGAFQLSRNSRWRYIGADSGSDPYLKVLRAHFMCPAPPPGKLTALFRRLRRPNPDNFLYDQE